MRFLSFDLEIVKAIPEGVTDWRTVAPLGISCVGLGFLGNVEFKHASTIRRTGAFSTPPDGLGLTQVEASRVVDAMLFRVDWGYTLLTFNGTSFDFQVLAEESGRWDDCARLALGAVDLMIIATFQQGWYVSLDSCLRGHGLASKQHSVRLNDGTMFDNMSGAKAPELWARGEVNAVLDYLKRDVESQYELAMSCQSSGRLNFVAKSGKRYSVRATRFPGSMDLLTVREMLSYRLPDQGWMTNPPTKIQFVQWMIDHAPAFAPELLTAVKS